MLIFLDESLRDDQLRPPLAPLAIDALLNLATAAYEGKHLLCGSRLLFGDLHRLSELGSVAAARFREASLTGTEAIRLRSSLAASIHVHPIGAEPRFELLVAVDGEPLQFVFHLPLSYFSDSARLGLPWLIGEHPRDATTYVALGRAFVAPYKSLRCNLRKADGHGGATHQTFELMIQQRETALCIVDSDRTSPSSPVGQTATKVRECRSKLKADQVAAAHVLPCRELENLLPEALVIDTLPEDPQEPHRVRVLEHRHRLGNADFSDLKDLVKLEQISEHLARCTPHEAARLCLAKPVHPALQTLSNLVGSFGVASRRGRT